MISYNSVQFYRSLKNCNPQLLVCSISRTDIAKEEFVFYWVESKWNCNALCSVHHIVSNISSRPRSPKFPLSFRVPNWNIVWIFNFPSAFLLFHLSHCLSVHHPPPFTDQHKSCSSSLCNFVQPPATPSIFRTIISLSLCSSALFKCLVLWNTTHTLLNTLNTF